MVDVICYPTPDCVMKYISMARFAVSRSGANASDPQTDAPWRNVFQLPLKVRLPLDLLLVPLLPWRPPTVYLYPHRPAGRLIIYGESTPGANRKNPPTRIGFRLQREFGTICRAAAYVASTGSMYAGPIVAGEPSTSGPPALHGQRPVVGRSSVVFTSVGVVFVSSAAVCACRLCLYAVSRRSNDYRSTDGW